MTQPHIHLSADLGVRHAILPGDPGRIDRILPFLSQVRELGFHREYRSALGLYQGLPVLAMSTGMGGDSIGSSAHWILRGAPAGHRPGGSNPGHRRCAG